MLLFEQIANDLRLALPPIQVSAHARHLSVRLVGRILPRASALGLLAGE